MVNDPYGLIASGLPPELVSQLMGTKGRQAISQAMLEQSMQPIQVPEAKGRFTVAASPLQGVAKVMQAYMGAKGLGEQDKDFAKIATQYQTGKTDALARMGQISQGTPASGQTSVPQMGEMGESYPPQLQGGTPAVPGNPQEAVKYALTNAYLKNEPYTQFESARLGKSEDLSAANTLRVEENKRAEMVRIEAAKGASRQATLDKQAAATQNEQLRRDLNTQNIDLRRELSTPKPKPLNEAQKLKMDKTIAQDFSTASSVKNNMDEILGAISNIKESKGLSAREGYTGYVPAWLQGKEAMSAENRIQTLKGKITQMGKAIATASGAIGPMAVQEWKIVADAVNAIDPTAGNLEEQLTNIESQAIGAKNRAVDIYDRTYGERFDLYPQFNTESLQKSNKDMLPTDTPAKPGTVLRFDAQGNPIP